MQVVLYNGHKMLVLVAVAAVRHGLLWNMNISRASNFRELSRITKLNTWDFPEQPIAKNVSASNINISGMRYAIFSVKHEQ